MKYSSEKRYFRSLMIYAALSVLTLTFATSTILSAMQSSAAHKKLEIAEIRTNLISKELQNETARKQKLESILLNTQKDLVSIREAYVKVLQAQHRQEGNVRSNKSYNILPEANKNPVPPRPEVEPVFIPIPKSKVSSETIFRGVCTSC